MDVHNQIFLSRHSPDCMESATACHFQTCVCLRRLTRPLVFAWDDSQGALGTPYSSTRLTHAWSSPKDGFLSSLENDSMCPYFWRQWLRIALVQNWSKEAEWHVIISPCVFVSVCYSPFAFTSDDHINRLVANDDDVVSLYGYYGSRHSLSASSWQISYTS